MRLSLTLTVIAAVRALLSALLSCSLILFMCLFYICVSCAFYFEQINDDDDDDDDDDDSSSIRCVEIGSSLLGVVL